MKKIKTRDVIKWSLPVLSGLILVIFSDNRDSSGRVNATDGLINAVMDIDNPKSEVALEKVDNTAAKSEKKKSKDSKKKANNIIQPIEIPEIVLIPLVDDLIKQDIVVPEQSIEQPIEQLQPKPTLPIEPDVPDVPGDVIPLPLPTIPVVPEVEPDESIDNMPQPVEPNGPQIDEPDIQEPNDELDEPNVDTPEVELPTQDIDNMPQPVEPDELPDDSDESDNGDELIPMPPIIPELPDWLKPTPPIQIHWYDRELITGDGGSITNIVVKERIKWNNILPR